MTHSMEEAIKQAATSMNDLANKTELFKSSNHMLPDRSKIIEITEKLRALMFPGYFGIPSVQTNEFAAGAALSDLCSELFEQAKAVLSQHQNAEEEAETVVTEFVSQLPSVQKLLLTDVEALFVGDPAAFSKTDVIFSYPGLFAITVYRLAHILYENKLPLIPRMMTEYAHSLTGIDINAGAKIGKYFFIDHGTGVVIGETCIIGDYVKLYQGVTLGALSTRRGQQLAGIKRHPTIGNRVTIYSGASILGGDTVIGDDCLIGGNAFVTSSVPANTRVSVKSPELTFREMQ